MTTIHPNVQEALDSIDASFFSGDQFHSKENFEFMDFYLQRWIRESHNIRNRFDKNIHFKITLEKESNDFNQFFLDENFIIKQTLPSHGWIWNGVKVDMIGTDGNIHMTRNLGKGESNSFVLAFKLKSFDVLESHHEEIIYQKLKDISDDDTLGMLSHETGISQEDLRRLVDENPMTANQFMVLKEHLENVG